MSFYFCNHYLICPNCGRSEEFINKLLIIARKHDYHISDMCNIDDNFKLIVYNSRSFITELTQLINSNINLINYGKKTLKNNNHRDIINPFPPYIEVEIINN